MSQLVQSLEHAVEAGVKGIIGLAEGYMSGTCPSQAEASASGTGTDDVKPTASGQQPQPINISTGMLPPLLSAPTTGNSSGSSPSARPPQSLASRLALAQDTLVQVTDISSGWIHLQSTYLDHQGGQRKVRSFGLRNVSQTPIDVEVASDLEDNQVVFWVADEGEPEAERNSSQSSSSSAAGSSIASTATPSVALKLRAGESRTVFLAFQPTTSQPSTPAGTSTPSSDGGFTPRVAPMAASSELSPPPGGKLPPAASSSSTGASLKSESTLASTSVASSNLSVGSNSAGRKHDPVHRSFSVHGSILVHATTAEDDVTNPPAQQNVTVPFFATVCRSFFSLGVIDPTSGLASGPQITKGELAIDFGTDVVVGQDVHRDLLLVNRSEIDLVWTTSVTNSPFKDSVWFLLRDLDSENVFGVDTSSEPVPLPPLSSRHLRLTLRAEAPVANFEFEFRLCNNHQTGNAVVCRAVGSCHTEASDDTLRILSGSALDFGQVPDGTWAKKLISCKNSGDRPIDVHFSATEGYEVVFRLAGVAGEDIDEDMPAVRPARDKRMDALSRTSTRDTREGRPRDLSGTRQPNDSDDWFEQANANGLIDPAGSMPSSRPLSRVTSIASSSRPLRGEDADSDDDESAAAAIPDLRPSDNLGDRDIPNQIEELTMRPGTEYRVFAMYRPTRDLNSPPEIAGALRGASFKIYLDSIPSTQRSRPIPRSRKVIHCTAESCTSVISIPSGHVIDFGEVTVGASKSTTIAIQNLSALSARVEIAAISKVLNTNRNVIIIPPFETVHERVDFFPRRINDKYEKQVFVRNHLNRANNQLIEVHSKNVDVYNVTLHSHLYRILTPGGSNFLDFGSVVINSPSVRTVQFQNLTHRPLTLDLSASHPEDLELYIKDTDAPQVPDHSADVSTPKLALPADDRPQNGNLKERFVESLQDKDSGESKEKTKAAARHKTIKKVHKDDDKRDIGTTLVAALKKGSRGKHVQLYNDAVVFKDRSLLDDLEFLDLASGPPLSANRTPANSKRTHMLETIAFEDKSKLSGQHPKALKLDFAASAKSSGLVSKENREGRLRKAKSSAGSSRRDPSTRRTADPSTPTKQVAKYNGTPPSPSSAQRTPVVKQQPQQQQQLITKSPALTGRRLELKSDPACVADVNKLTPDELLAAVEHMDAKRSSASVTHLSPEEEEQYVRRLLDLRKELRSSISAGKFVPARVLTVPPGASRQLVVVMTPNGSTRPHVTTRAKRSEQRIVIKLLEYDHSLLSGVMGAHCDLSELPVRDLVIRSSCVRSVLEVQQSSINFGTCERGEVKSRMIVIHNRSDCVGVYRLRTSGSIASGNLKLGLGRYGVVSAFGRKEVASFSFTPSLVGNYNETIAVENVLDAHNNQNVLVKATVRKMPTFSLDVTKIDFTPTQTNSWPASAGFVITNTSKTERTFVVEVAAPADSAFAELSLSRDEKDAGVALSRGEEEEVEGLLQKLKIARRKNKPDKIAKYEKRLGELGVATASAEEAALAITPDDETAEMASGAFTPAAGELASTPTIQVTLGASKKAKVLVALLPRSGNEAFSTAIKVYERKNTDETVTIEVNGAPHVAPAAPPPSPPASPEDPLNLAIMKHALELTLQCPVSPTAFCVGSTLFLPRSSPLYDALTPHFPTFPDPVTGESAGLVLADGYSRQIPGNTHAEANALANFRERLGELESAEAQSASNAGPNGAPSENAESPSQSQAGTGLSEKTEPLPSTDDILTQATCYATMEPCSVRTSGGPSCALELVRAHVKVVYLGVEEPPDFVQCEGVRILEQGGVEVRRVVGLEEECLRLARRGRT